MVDHIVLLKEMVLPNFNLPFLLDSAVFFNLTTLFSLEWLVNLKIMLLSTVISFVRVRVFWGSWILSDFIKGFHHCHIFRGSLAYRMRVWLEIVKLRSHSAFRVIKWHFVNDYRLAVFFVPNISEDRALSMFHFLFLAVVIQMLTLILFLFLIFFRTGRMAVRINMKHISFERLEHSGLSIIWGYLVLNTKIF